MEPHYYYSCYQWGNADAHASKPQPSTHPDRLVVRGRHKAATLVDKGDRVHGAQVIVVLLNTSGQRKRVNGVCLRRKRVMYLVCVPARLSSQVRRCTACGVHWLGTYPPQSPPLSQHTCTTSPVSVSIWMIFLSAVPAMSTFCLSSSGWKRTV